LDWSFHNERCELRETYLNYENKAIYNNGIVVKRQLSGDFMVELVTSVPRDACTATLGTAYSQTKNHLNYTYEQAQFQANPVPFFESIGYKVVRVALSSTAVSSTRRWSASGRWPSGWRWSYSPSTPTCKSSRATAVGPKWTAV
jgi:hypothetical protein